MLNTKFYSKPSLDHLSQIKILNSYYELISQLVV